jgi:hypothetical protein
MVVFAFVAVFLPLFPLIPPGLLLTMLYQRFWKLARKFITYKDIAKLPINYLNKIKFAADNRNGDMSAQYGYKVFNKNEMPPLGSIPLVTPREKAVGDDEYYIFGDVLSGDLGLPAKPVDVLNVFGAFPGKLQELAKNYAYKAYFYEIFAWIFLVAGIALNIFFAVVIINLLL